MMTHEQDAALIIILADARDLLLAIDKKWIRLEDEEGKSPFIVSLRKSVSDAARLNIPATFQSQSNRSAR